MGDSVSGAEAERLGLIWRCVDDEALETEAMALASRLATLPPVAVGLVKRALAKSPTNDLEAQLEVEREFQLIARQTEDHREGLRAFAEKRTATFRGR